MKKAKCIPLKPSENILLWVFIIVILFLAYLVIRPIFKPIISGILLGYLFYPLYQSFLTQKRINLSSKTAGGLILLIIIMFLIVPLLLTIVLLGSHRETITGFINILLPQLKMYFADYSRLFDNGFFKLIGFKLDLENILRSVSGELLRTIQILLTSVPNFLLNSFVILVIVYYTLHKADQVLPFLRRMLPLRERHLSLIITRFNGFTRGLLASQFMIAFIQGILMFIALAILGNRYLFFLALLSFIFALIPFLGAVVVWGSITIYLFLKYTAGGPLWQPIFMLVYGSLLVSMVDNFIRPKMIADSANVNFVIVLIGLLGGFVTFGLPGIFLGPLILTLLDVALDIYREIK